MPSNSSQQIESPSQTAQRRPFDAALSTAHKLSLWEAQGREFNGPFVPHLDVKELLHMHGFSSCLLCLLFAIETTPAPWFPLSGFSSSGYAAQQESFPTSFSNVSAASLRPSDMVR